MKKPRGFFSGWKTRKYLTRLFHRVKKNRAAFSLGEKAEAFSTANFSPGEIFSANILSGEIFAANILLGEMFPANLVFNEW